MLKRDIMILIPGAGYGWDIEIVSCDPNGIKPSFENYPLVFINAGAHYQSVFMHPNELEKAIQDYYDNKRMISFHHNTFESFLEPEVHIEEDEAPNFENNEEQGATEADCNLGEDEIHTEDDIDQNNLSPVNDESLVQKGLDVEDSKNLAWQIDRPSPEMIRQPLLTPVRSRIIKCKTDHGSKPHIYLDKFFDGREQAREYMKMLDNYLQLKPDFRKDEVVVWTCKFKKTNTQGKNCPFYAICQKFKPNEKNQTWGISGK